MVCCARGTILGRAIARPALRPIRLAYKVADLHPAPAMRGGAGADAFLQPDHRLRFWNTLSYAAASGGATSPKPKSPVVLKPHHTGGLAPNSGKRSGSIVWLISRFDRDTGKVSGQISHLISRFQRSSRDLVPCPLALVPCHSSCFFLLVTRHMPHVTRHASCCLPSLSQISNLESSICRESTDSRNQEPVPAAGTLKNQRRSDELFFSGKNYSAVRLRSSTAISFIPGHWESTAE
jgi:hypothetical protein